MRRAAAVLSLELFDMDRRRGEISAVSSRPAKLDPLRSLTATPEKRPFLAGLLTCELRQSAHEGLMADAVARATGIAPDRIRRAAMMAGAE